MVKSGKMSFMYVYIYGWLAVGHTQLGRQDSAIYDTRTAFVCIYRQTVWKPGRCSMPLIALHVLRHPQRGLEVICVLLPFYPSATRRLERQLALCEQ